MTPEKQKEATMNSEAPPKKPRKTSPLRGKGPIDPEDRKPPDVLSAPDAKAHEKIKKQGTWKVTALARAFIIQCVLTGYTNAQINALLRDKKFLATSQSDLPDETLHKIRDTQDCAIDLARLTLEARQVGHNRISQTIIQWAEVQDAAFDMLLRNKELTPKKGTLGYGLKPPTMGELSSLAFNASKIILEILASKIILEILASGLAEQLEEELAEVKAGKTAAPKQRRPNSGPRRKN